MTNEEFEALLDKIEKGLYKSYLESIDTLKASIDVDALAILIEQGRTYEATQLINDAAVKQGMAPFTNTVASSYSVAGAKFIDSIPPLKVGSSEFKIAFDVQNPQLQNILMSRKVELLNGVTRDMSDVVYQTINTGIRDGLGAKQIARDFREVIGLTDKQENIVQNYKRLLKDEPMQALSRELRDKRFDKTVRKAVRLKQPLPDDVINKMVSRYREKFTKLRAETIARTQGIQILSESERQGWVQMIDDGVVKEQDIERLWVAGKDGRTRSSHVAIPRLNEGGVGMNQPFQSPLGAIMYPGDPSASLKNRINCRCRVITRFR
ncbi:MAG: hypothetical protein EBR82_10055 [Caulobacteraceae bacterium]|nr:hypothetical protein [Caulobacteraceae bacterium]